MTINIVDNPALSVFAKWIVPWRNKNGKREMVMEITD